MPAHPDRDSGHHPPTTPGAEPPPELDEQPQPPSNAGVDRGQVIARGYRTTAQLSARFIIITAALALLLWLLAQVWVGVLPILLSLILATVLWPPVAWMTRRGAAPVLAAATTLVLALLVVVGTLAAIAPSIVDQVGEIGERAGEGVSTVRAWLAGPPLNVDSAQLDEAIDQGTAWVQERSSDIASGLFTGVSVVSSWFVTLALVLVLTFFFLKDGPTFLPWVRRVTGRSAGRHLTELFTRIWLTLGGFVRAQAMVSAFDALFIGVGLLILGVPLAFALAVLTFFAGFIPIVGAVTAGALAVLVALVSNGWQVALIVLGIVLLVQQIEGNVLQPMLQGRTMQMHAGIILLAVAAGATLFGIIGAFLAVPVAASVVVTLRYLSEQIDLRTGDQHASELPVVTPEGAVAAAIGEGEAKEYEKLERRREQEHARVAETTAPAPEAPREQAPRRLLQRLGSRDRSERR